MVKVFKVLGYIWLYLYGTLLAMFVIGTILKRDFVTLAEIFNPLDVTTSLSLSLVLGPGIAALILADWLEKRKSPPKP
jgi:hypothetical protein